ncbi:polysaccharide biosynthesis protein [Hoeflea sp.]|uniref:polysaccharide biosynthesis protein n=1 Tax=Hoeflea sp. TaxID=1940281 RepID=UPI003BB1AFAD
MDSNFQAARIATSREESMFKGDLDARSQDVSSAVEGKRILAIGAAGSIGSSTIRTIAGFAPRAIHVIDQNENALAELVRQLRSAPEPFRVEDFQLLPLDYGSALTRAFIAENGPYDLVLNFAAIKHVRSEKDPFSILQMLDTNLVKQARFLAMLTDLTPKSGYFSVSTDKAANPSSFMGATKRAMEHVLFSEATASGFEGRITSARFANVAFSNGSLLQSFENRMARGEPIAAPQGIRRYFVSLEESGHICTLASLFLDRSRIGVPDLDPESHLVPLTDVAEGFITARGFEPAIYHDETEARLAVGNDRARGRWPLLLTPGDTAGEKPYEEFVARGEEVVETGLAAIRAVVYNPLARPDILSQVLSELEATLTEPSAHSGLLDKNALKQLIGRLEPAFLESHVDSALNLDQRV